MTDSPIRRENWKTDMYTRKTMLRHREKTAVWKLRREDSEDTSPVETYS